MRRKTEGRISPRAGVFNRSLDTRFETVVVFGAGGVLLLYCVIHQIGNYEHI